MSCFWYSFSPLLVLSPLPRDRLRSIPLQQVGGWYCLSVEKNRSMQGQGCGLLSTVCTGQDGWVFVTTGDIYQTTFSAIGHELAFCFPVLVFGIPQSLLFVTCTTYKNLTLQKKIHRNMSSQNTRNPLLIKLPFIADIFGFPTSILPQVVNLKQSFSTCGPKQLHQHYLGPC